jgi:uncharacterized protein
LAPTHRQRVVLDSNLIVSAFLNPQGTASSALQIALAHFDVVSSKETLGELLEVLRRDKFDRYASLQARTERLQCYAEATQKYPVTLVVTDCQDPKDNKFLALALTAEAKLLVSGDKKHLLSMHPFKGVDIVSVRTFLDQYADYV